MATKKTVAAEPAAETPTTEDLQAKIAELEAQLKEKEAETKAPAVEDDGEKLVTVKLFKDGGKYSGDVFVAVNGDRIQIQRGVEVQIKKKFADVLENSMQQDINTANYIDRQQNEFEAKRKQLE